MPVHHEDVRPAVVVEIEKAHTPAHILRIAAHAAVVNNFFKSAVAVVAVQIRRVIDEVGLYQVQVSIAIKISRSGSHAGLLAPVLAVCYACFNCNIGEGTVAVVSKQEARLGIDGDVNIGPAVVIEVEWRNGHRISSSD